MHRILLLSSFFLLFLSCSKEQKKQFQISGHAQGTTYHIKYYSSKENITKNEIDSLLNQFDKIASLYDDQSELSKLNTQDSLLNPSKELLFLIKRSFQINTETTGAFDITIGQLVRSWGFWKTESLNPDSSMIDSLRNLCGTEKILVSKDDKKVSKKHGTLVDFNAIAQGYSVDLLSDFFEARGVVDYIIEVGGEVRAAGKHNDGRSFTVGIERPAKTMDAPQELYRKAVLNNRSMATSGSTRKYYEQNGIKYSHTIDPKTGFPVTHSLLSVSVLADRCTDADAFATAFMVLGVEKSFSLLKNRKDLEAFFIYSDQNGNLKDTCTPGFLKILSEE